MLETKKSTNLFTDVSPKDFIDSHIPRTTPNPPLELVKFRTLDKYERLKKSDFFKQSHIQEYLKDKWRAEEYNYSSFKALYGFMDIIKYNHPEELDHLKAKLLEFKFTIIHTDHPFPALGVDFNIYDVADVKDEEIVGWDD